MSKDKVTTFTPTRLVFSNSSSFAKDPLDNSSWHIYSQDNQCGSTNPAIALEVCFMLVTTLGIIDLVLEGNRVLRLVIYSALNLAIDTNVLQIVFAIILLVAASSF